MSEARSQSVRYCPHYGEHDPCHDAKDAVIAELRARVERMEKVVSAAGRLATSLVPFRGSIDTWPVPQIKSRCRVNDGLYTIPKFRDAVIDAIAALTPEKAKSEGPCDYCRYPVGTHGPKCKAKSEGEV